MNKNKEDNFSKINSFGYGFFYYLIKNRYEVMAVILMTIITAFNFGWLSLKKMPETPPGYYENILIQHTELLIKLRDEYQKQRIDMRKEMTSGPHSYYETARIALKLNIAETRYLDFWLLERPIVIGMFMPFNESKHVGWYTSLSPETLEMVKDTANKLNDFYPRLANCYSRAVRDYQTLFSGLSEPSSDKMSGILVAQTQVILRNISDDENTPSQKCDTVMIEYLSSVQRLSGVYSSLVDAYQSYSDKIETIRKTISALLSFMLLLVCYRCRDNLVKKIAKSMSS